MEWKKKVVVGFSVIGLFTFASIAIYCLAEELHHQRQIEEFQIETSSPTRLVEESSSVQVYVNLSKNVQVNKEGIEGLRGELEGIDREHKQQHDLVLSHVANLRRRIKDLEDAVANLEGNVQILEEEQQEKAAEASGLGPKEITQWTLIGVSLLISMVSLALHFCCRKREK